MTNQTNDLVPTTEQKFANSEKKLYQIWYIPAIAFALVVAMIVTVFAFSRSTTYGHLLESGKIHLGMTKDEAKALLGEPSSDPAYETASLQELFSLLSPASTVIGTPLTDNTMVFKESLCVKFNKKGELIQAFYNSDGGITYFSLGDTWHLLVAYYEPLYDADSTIEKKGLVVFTDGSVYLGEVNRKGVGDPMTGIISFYRVELPFGTYDLPRK